MNFRFSLPQEVPTIADAPFLGPRDERIEKPVEWIVVYGDRNNEINFKESIIVGQGAYGRVFLPPDSPYVVKYMIMRKDKRVVREPGESYADAFIKDVLRESKMQERAYSEIRSIVDGLPMVPRFIGSGVFRLNDYGDLGAVIIMERLGDEFVKMGDLYYRGGKSGHDLIFDEDFLRRLGVTKIDSFADSLYHQFAHFFDESHKLDIFHNDLQNANMFVRVGNEPLLKIIDFGLARTKADSIRLLESRGYDTTDMLRGREYNGGRWLDSLAEAAERYHSLSNTY